MKFLCVEIIILYKWGWPLSPLNKPRSSTAQSRTYSVINTPYIYTPLIGFTLTGAIIFVSNLLEVILLIGISLNIVVFLIMSDLVTKLWLTKGFFIRNLLWEKGAKLVLHPFTENCNWGKGNKFLQSDIIKTRRIANLRIHVECAIERVKTFNILSNTMPLTLKPLSNQILKVCAFLCNLQTPLWWKNKT